MNLVSLRRRRLVRLAVWCSALAVPSVLAWLVNVELAVRVFAPGLVVLERLMPQRLFETLAVLSADLSTISTLVPVLLFGFPLFMARRLLRRAGDEEALRTLVYDPYPPHFPFFLVMLGLVGTLYGMMIGLDTSGVADLSAQAPTPEQIQQTLDRLLGGTATAILSSLLGLVGAFLAARPFTWIFHWAACVPPEEERASLSDTLHLLTGDLRQLGEASRAFGERLHRVEAEAIPSLLRDMRDALRDVQSALMVANEKSDALRLEQEAGRAALSALRQLDKLDRLEAIESSMADSAGVLARQADSLDQLVDLARSAAADAAEDRRRAMEDRTSLLSALQGARDQRAAAMALLEQQGADHRRDREAVRRAFAQLAASDSQPSVQPSAAPP